MDTINSVTSAALGEAGKQITERLFKFMGREIGYVFNCNQYVDKLQDGVENLRAEMETVQGRVDRARDNAEEIEPNVSKWLSEAGDLVNEVDQFLAAHADRPWASGASIFKRRRLGKAAEEMSETVTNKLKESGRFDSFGHRGPLTDICLFQSNTGYQSFESRAEVFNDIMEAVENDNVYTVGIYGMAGVGKTTMAREIAKQAKDKKLFDKTLLVSISQNPDLRKVQGELADFLGLTLDKESLPGRASLLCTRFKEKGEKILVVVDDVWGKIKMEDVGIPLNAYCKGCKLVLTSRTQGVLVGEGVGVDKEFQIGVLRKDEAWLLFMEKLQNSIDSHPELRSVAEEICRECGGLPLPIVTLGAALRNKKPLIWDDTLDQLKNCRGNYIKGMTANVYFSIELSYHFLEHIDTKACFLYCCLYPEGANIPIEDLVHYGVGRRFLLSRVTMEAARKRVCTIVDTLKISCLLLEGRNENFVKMHDMIRDVGTSIAEKDKEIMLLVRSGGDWPQQDELPCCKTISSWLFQNEKLPNVLECPELRTLALHCSFDSAQEVPDSFFEVAKKLEVLCLDSTNLLTATSSISKLANIRMLYLQNCMMENLSFLKDLKKLEILRINDSSIEALPEEVVKLSQLRVLDLREHFKRGTVLAGLISSMSISSLSRLEELCISNEWESEDNPWIGELNSLRNLSNLEIHIPAANANACDLQCAKSLIRYKISVGGFFDIFDDYYSDTRTLKLEAVGLNGWAKVLMKKANALYLVGIKGLQKVFEDRDEEWFLDLKFLQVKNCKDETEYGIFPLLGKPKWNNLQIIQDNPSPSPLGKLSILRMSKCGFKYLFSLSVARGLPQLQELVVEECESIEEIVRDDDNEQVAGDKAVLVLFAQLKILKLNLLPNLISFYANTKIKSIAQPLFNGKVSCPALERLEVSKLDGITTIWENQIGLKVASSFLQLQHLYVQNCEKLVNVVSSRAYARLQADDEMVRFPKLVTIYLKHLLNIRTFCCIFRFKEETIEDKLCEVKALFSDEVSCPALELLEVSKLDGITTIWENQIGLKVASSFPQLQALHVQNCEKLVNVVSSHAYARLQADDEMVRFPKLVSIELKCLPNIRTFCCIFRSKEETMEDKLCEVKALFSDKVSCPALGLLEVSKLDGITTIWENQIGLKVASSFLQLQRLFVNNCEKLVNFVSSRAYARLQVDDEMPRFPKLVAICLEHLPNIRTFCCIFRSKEETMEDKLCEVKALFSDEVSYPALEQLSVSKLDGITTIWENQIGLEVASSFLQLQALYVEDCEKLVNVFSNRAYAKLQVDDEMVKFPKLATIKLKYLPNMRTFYCIFRSKEETMEDKFCEVRTLFSDEVKLPCLMKLAINSIPKLTKIWDVNVPTDSCGEVQRLTIKDCSELLCVAPSKLLKSFHGLQRLTLGDCLLLEEIFRVGASSETEENIVNETKSNLLLPQLECVFFYDLPNLRSIYSRCSTSKVLSSATDLQIKGCPILKKELGMNTSSSDEEDGLNISSSDEEDGLNTSSSDEEDGLNTSSLDEEAGTSG